ncbi:MULTISPECIES: ferredoxin--NADP reductase [Gammaproteobacteria]|uniref:ferredoxin--NADP reductase n=1 Tax=Gammaproteobacteria TaxID=1236 RepID=UPI000DD0AD64|nr:MULTISPECIES: ferredoxin--NADP reductase [Gammaproteobacteria]RTE85780.1 ferredoxin--NADP reductase [Aliidiomarina sp. B3213]TCZ90217.1 ferredoxin--NADP reductase [Lysobacter sp. N42]
MPGWIEGTVVEKKFWNPHLLTLSLEVEPLDFTPGQFVRIALPVTSEQERPVFRAYSLVNSPNSNILEFVIAVVPDGEVTPQLAALEVGAQLIVAQPVGGFFTLNDVPQAKSLWMMSTGTGLGPYLSMLSSEAPWQNFEKVVLVHAVRTQQDLCYAEKISGWKQQYPEQFVFQPVVSREAISGALQGRIPGLIESGALEQQTQVQLDQSAQIMLCGNPHMIKDTRETLEQRGLTLNTRRKPGNVTIEQYWKG